MYNRTSGTFYTQGGTDQYGNQLPTFGGAGENTTKEQNLYWQSMSQRFAQMGFASPHYAIQDLAKNIDTATGQYAQDFFGRMGTENALYNREGFFEEGKSEFNAPRQLYQGHQPNPAEFNAAVDAYRASLYDLDSNYQIGRATVPTGGMSNADYIAEYSATRDWHKDTYDGIAQSTNSIRDMIVDNFGMMDELIKVGYSIEEAGEILNKSALSPDDDGTTFDAKNRTKWEDTMKSRYEEAAVFGGILDDFQVAYDKKAVEYHDSKLVELNILQLLSPEKYDEAWNNLSLKDKNVQAFKMYEKGMLEPPGRRQELENKKNRGGERKYTDAQIDAIVGDEATKQYKRFVMSNMEQSGLYDHVYILPAGSPQGGSTTTEDMYVAKMKGSAFYKDASYEIDDNFFFGDDPVSTAGQYGYQRVKFFPDETLKAGGVYGPDSTYRTLNTTNNYAEYFIDDETTEEDRALRKDVGKLETVGGLGEYLDVSIDKTFAMPGFARAASSFMSPWVALTTTAMDVVFNDKTLTLADYMSAGLSALKAFDIITPPASAKEVKAAGEAAEMAADATWEVGDAFTSVGRSAMDTFRAANAGVGLAGMSYSQTVGLINAVATGDPMSFIFSEFGSDLMDGALEEFGVDLDTLDPGIKQGLYKGMNKLAQGEDWETAFTSGVATWLRDTELGGDFIDSLREIGRDLDDQYLQPILDAIPDEINSGDLNLPSWDEITEWAAGSVGGLTDGFKVILSEMNNIIPGISDESKAVIGEFVEAIPTTNIESAISKLGQMTGGVFDNLDEGIKDALEQGLQDAVINGEVDEAAMARAVSAGAITVNAIGEQFPEYLKDVAGARLITQSIQNAVTSAMLGGDASDAFLSTIATAATKAIQKSIDEGTLFDDLAQYQDKVTGEYTKTRLATDRMNTAQSTYNQAVTGAKALEAEMQEREEALEVLRVRAETTGRESDQDAYDDAFEAYSTYIANEAGPAYSDFIVTMNDAEQDFTDAKTDFDAASVDLNDATVVLNDNVAPVYQDVMKGAVAEIDPNFDEAWYRQKYDIPDGVSAYDHYINSGVQFAAPTNADAFTAQYDAAFNKLMHTAITASGINPAKLSPEELQRIRNQLFNRYGRGSIQSLKDGIANESALKWRVQSSLMALSDLGNAQDFVLTEQNIDSMKERLEAAGLPFEDLTVGDSVPVSDRRNLAVAENQQKSSMGIELGGATDWADVVSGAAQLTFNPVSGKLSWEVMSSEGSEVVSYADDYGLLTQQFDAEGNEIITQVDTGNIYTTDMKPLKGTFDGVEYEFGMPVVPVGETVRQDDADGSFRFYEHTPDGTITVTEHAANGMVSGGGEVTPNVTTQAGGGRNNLRGLKSTNPEAYLATLGTMPEGEATQMEDAWWHKTAKAIMDDQQAKTGNGAMLTTLALTMEGLVELSDAVVNAYEWASGNETGYSEGAKAIVDLAQSYRPEDFNQNVEQMYKDIGEGEGISGSIEAVFGAMVDYPVEFFSDVVFKELVQAGPGLALGKAVYLGGKAILSKADTLAELGEKIAVGLGVGTAVSVDLAESYGAEAQGAYEEAYDTAINAERFNAVTGQMERIYTPEEAETLARDIGENIGMKSLLITAASMGLGNAALTKIVFGKNKGFDDLSISQKNLINQIAARGERAVTTGTKEFIGEGFEEGAIALAFEDIIADVDPNTPRDSVGNVVTNSLLGAIGGGGSSSIGSLFVGTPDGGLTLDFGELTQIHPPTTMLLEGFTPSGDVVNDIATLQQGLEDIGYSNDTPLLANIMNEQFDYQFTSSEEAAAAFEAAGYVPTQAEIDAFVMENHTEAQQGRAIAEYIDPLFLTVEEVQEAALAEGVILTDEEAEVYAGQGSESIKISNLNRALDNDTEGDLGTPVVTVDQIKNEFLSNGRIITDAQAEQFLGTTLEDAQEGIGKFLAAKPGYGMPTVGLGKIRATGIDDHGVYLTNAQMQQFLSKYGPDNISEAIGEWVASEPEGIRYTITEQQVRDFAESKGYTLSDEEVAQFTRKTVSAAEVQMGQKFQNDPEFGTLIPAAQNELNALRDDLNARIDAIMENDPNASRLDAIDAAIDSLVQADNEFVTHAQLAAALSQMGGDIDADIKEVADSVADVETRLAEAFNAALEVEGTTRDEAIAAAVAQVSGDLDITKAELLETINTDDAALNDRITTLNEARKKEIATLRTNVWNAIGELRTDRDGQAATDEELQAALDDLAVELGTTREDILSKLGTTTDALNTLDQEVADLETDLNDKIDANLAADMERDAAVNKAIADIVAENENFTTHAEVAEYLSDYRTGEEITAEIQTVADSVTELETELVKLINANADESLTEDQKLDQAIQDLAAELGTDIGTIYSRLGAAQVARKALGDRITKVKANLKAEIDTLRDNVWESIGKLRARVDSNDLTDAQLQEAIDEVAADLGTTSADILSKLGTTTADLNALNQEVADLETDLNDKIGANLAADMERDAAVNKAIADIVAENENFTTHAEVAEYLSNYRTGEEITAEIQTVADSVTELEERLVALINANTDADLSDTERLDQAIADLAAELGTDIGTIFSRLGAAADARTRLDTRITTVRDNINARISRVRDQLQEQINANLRAGMDKDAALQAAIDAVAGDLDTTEQGILDQLGTTRQELEADIAGLQTQVDDITTQINALMNQGVSFDDALAQVAGDLQTTEDALLAQMGKDKQELSDDIDVLRGQVGDVQTQLGGIEGQIAELMNQGVSFDDALAQIAGDLQTTEDALLAQMGKDKQELSDDIDVLRGQLGDVQSQIAELMNQGATFEEALAQVAGDLQTTEDALLTQMGKDKQELSDDIDVLRGQVGDVQTQLGDIQGQITTLMQQGATFEEALAQVAGDLQTTEDTLLAQMGTDKEALEAQIGTVQTQVADLGTTLNNRIDELEAQTGDRDAAITQAINELAEQQGTDTATLLAQLEQQKTANEEVARILGKPAREVTQDDIDAVTDFLANQETLDDPAYVPTAEEMLYDVNADGVINEIDQALLEDSFAGQDVQFAESSIFGPSTGLYAQIDAQNELLAEQEAQRQADLEAQQQAELERQQAYSDANYLAQQQAQEEDILERLGQATQAQSARTATTRTPKELAEIDYLFDVYGDEIFATPQQKELFASPYGSRTELPPQRVAKGGIIQTNDELLRLIGE